VTSRRALQATLAALGTVATTTGAVALARGTHAVLDPPAAHPNVDSEHRWFAVWWTALGPVLWTIAKDPEEHERAVRAIAATAFAGGLARRLAARQSGEPHPLYRALTAVELVLPPVLVAWQARVRAARD
jgi:hypothetical protein